MSQVSLDVVGTTAGLIDSAIIVAAFLSRSVTEETLVDLLRSVKRRSQNRAFGLVSEGGSRTYLSFGWTLK